jgi:hypothetical protein
MMSLQLYQNASQGPRKSKLMEWDLDAEIRELSGRCDRNDRDGSSRYLDHRQGPHRTTSDDLNGKFCARTDAGTQHHA